MKKESWIVVANSFLARLFKLENQDLIEMNTLIHPEGRMRDRDLVADRPGQTNESAGMSRTSRSSMEPQHSPKKVEAIIFAKQIAEHLDLARSKGQVDKIYLAAAPSFLGLLRQEMNHLTGKLIAAEVDKDIVHLNPKEIKAYFPIGF